MLSGFPKVSVILPTHNGARYLAGALEALVAQSLENWELLAVDDASTDATPEILAEFARRDPRIRVIRNRENRKLPASLNIGFAASGGAFLTWTSDDNLQKPNALLKLVAFLEANPTTGLVYSHYSLIDESGKQTDRIHVRAPALLAFGNVVGASFLYRREVFEKIGGYNENLFLAEDYEYWLRIAAAFPVGILREDLYGYRLHSGSLTSLRQAQIAEAHEKALLLHLDKLPWLTARGRACALFNLAHKAELCSRRMSCGQLLLKALRTSPSAIFSSRRSYGSLFSTDVTRQLDEQDIADLEWMNHRRGGLAGQFLFVAGLCVK
ncbi:MAG: glycosyltransferase family A protein [Deltaproteobacteria bacterium]